MKPSPSSDLFAAGALHSGQERFLGALRSDAGGAGILDSGVFMPPPCDTTQARWEIYSQGYVRRLAEAIGNDYPAIARIAGPAAFTEVCRRYVSACPPASYDIGHAGAQLAGYLPHDPATQSLPFLPDLARFEWALAEAFLVRDTAPLAWSDVVAAGPLRFSAQPLRAIPGTAIIRSEWPLEELRLAKDWEDAAIDIPLENRPATLLVWRPGFQPRWKSATQEEASIVEGALTGKSPQLILESGAFGARMDAPQRLVAALRRIVELGILAPYEKEEGS